ncbi:TIGR01777 family oxidoreductase [Aeromicrobium sp. 9AM]|uniref:TIGR01777 family oxidoreductase n=1 Tax=Aeromicrobium sp. 9AM TaxID=2653126 RepID=UPI0012F1E1EE|nr:TIGR01777 family oxidoreductase [Aeromicrobium sp. 9AM]VXB10447.1 NAD-dependent epimerase [Aeromicrobium sp. 9AM]
MSHPKLQTAVIAGASGYIGQHLTRELAARGVDVRTIGRGAFNDATWDDPPALVDVLEGADLLVNLAGRSVSCRYTKRNADAIFASRTETTAALGRALAATARPPELWVNASTGTIYRDSRDRPMDEVTGELGTGFSVGVARAWEHELFAAPTPVRKVALRMSIVLGPGGGALNPFINLARMGFGGRMGDGGQKFSWAHVDDVVAAVTYAFEHPEISGPVNVAAPEVVTNAEMMRQVRDALGRHRGLPLPAWALEAGARVIRTEAELVLKSRWVDSRVLRESGFEFAHPSLADALDQIAGHTPRGLLPVALG